MSSTRRASILAASLWLVGLLLGGAETNYWPFYHHRAADELGRRAEHNFIGPIGARGILESGEKLLSLRPLYIGFSGEMPERGHFHVVYPFFNYYEHPDGWNWNVLNLMKMGWWQDAGRLNFEIFPFVFVNRERGEGSYYALWPLGGVLKQRLFRDRIQFALWPLYVESWKGDERRTNIPWPFLQFRSGPRSSGFGIWPLYGRFQREGDYRHWWALWPLIYDYRDDLDAVEPYRRFGVLPFYHRETAQGLKSETYLWPFFGYTREWSPRPQYNETRYFWPLVVQGRGEERYVNRLLPFYANERRPGYAKQWYLWPLLKRERWDTYGLRERTSLLYFLYWDERQVLREGSARKTFGWPFFGYWNDGAGRRQFQTLDPLSVFFPQNRKVQENWLPLFNLYRYDERWGDKRHSLLWNLVVYEKDAVGTGAFYLGPLYEVVDDGERGHWQLLKGLFGVERRAGERKLKLLWMGGW